MIKVVIGSRAKHEHKLEVKKEGCMIEWTWKACQVVNIP
jgi:hypothetical protein